MKKKNYVILVALFVLLLAGGYMAVKFYAERKAAKKIERTVARISDQAKVKYDSVSVNPLQQSLTLKDFGFSIAGGRRFTIGQVKIDSIDIKNRRPHYMAGTLAGVTLDVDSGNFGEFADDLIELGYRKIKADVKFDYSYTPLTQTLTVRTLEIKAEGLGNLALRGAVSRFDLDKLSEMQYEKVAVDNFHFEYQDASLLKKLVGLAWEKDREFMDFVVEGFREDLESARTKADETQAGILKHLIEFLRYPQQLSVRIELRSQLTSELLLTQKKISKLLRLFEIRLDNPITQAAGEPGGTRLQDSPYFRRILSYRPAMGTTIYTRDGQVLKNLSREKRFPVEIKDLPPYFIKAFLAAEDASFYDHEGLDPAAVLRAMMRNIEAGGIVQGGSTITQQIVKQLLLSSEKSFVRKIKEAILAYRLEEVISKDKILSVYVNEIFFGAGAYGVEAAAETYFGKHASELTVAESALVAGLPKAPTSYNPLNFPEVARYRQEYVLGRMHEQGWINSFEYESALNQPLNYRSASESPSVPSGPGAYYAEEVRRWLIENLTIENLRNWGIHSDCSGEEAVYSLGLRVHTAMDIKHQAAAEKALRDGLVESSKRRGWQGATRQLASSEYESFLNLQAFTIEKIEPGQWVEALVTDVDSSGAKVSVGNYSGFIGVETMSWCRTPDPASLAEEASPVTDATQVLSRGDVVWASVIEGPTEQGELKLKLEQKPAIQGGLVSIDPRSGDVLALVGGYDFNESQFNRATQARRQPGSAFKPIVYSAALDAGYTAASVINDEPFTFVDPHTSVVWEPQNITKKFYGQTTLRTALVKSRNTVTAQLAKAIGIDAVIRRARQMGLESDLPPYLSVSLGSQGVTLINLCQVYTTFARGGSYVEPRMVLSIEDSQGREIYKAETRTVDAVSPQNAFIITSLLKEVVQSGTGAVCRQLGRPVAGKTGTTNEERDAWFIGFSPYLLTGVYIGFDQHEPMGFMETGSRAAAPTWLKYRFAVEEIYPAEDFLQPPGIVFRSVSAPPGEDDSPNPPKSYILPFIEGTQPAAEPEGKATKSK